MAEEELRNDAGDEERRHDETDDGRGAAAVLEEERQEGQAQRCAHPLDRHDDRETAKRLLRGGNWHDDHASCGPSRLGGLAEGSALDQDEHAQTEVDPRDQRAAVTSAPRDHPRMARERLGRKDEHRPPTREDARP